MRKKRQQVNPAAGQKPSKRSKGRVADVYEAEDSDPDEEKHKNRYDVSWRWRPEVAYLRHSNKNSSS